MRTTSVRPAPGDQENGLLVWMSPAEMPQLLVDAHEQNKSGSRIAKVGFLHSWLGFTTTKPQSEEPTVAHTRWHMLINKLN